MASNQLLFYVFIFSRVWGRVRGREEVDRNIESEDEGINENVHAKKSKYSPIKEHTN